MRDLYSNDLATAADMAADEEMPAEPIDGDLADWIAQDPAHRFALPERVGSYQAATPDPDNIDRPF